MMDETPDSKDEKGSHAAAAAAAAANMYHQQQQHAAHMAAHGGHMVAQPQYGMPAAAAGGAHAPVIQQQHGMVMVPVGGKQQSHMIERPFVYGTAAFFLGKSAEEQHSHRWTVYVRGLDNEDMSYFIKRVQFQLHSSFKEPVRTLDVPPFEVTEKGWGEFQIIIRIFFIDIAGLPPVQLQHSLKLFPDLPAQSSTKKPVMSEKYDEFVFVQPNEMFTSILMNGPARKFHDHPLQQWRMLRFPPLLMFLLCDMRGVCNDFILIVTTTSLSEQEFKETELIKSASLAIQNETERLRRQLYELEAPATD